MINAFDCCTFLTILLKELKLAQNAKIRLTNCVIHVILFHRKSGTDMLKAHNCYTNTV